MRIVPPALVLAFVSVASPCASQTAVLAISDVKPLLGQQLRIRDGQRREVAGILRSVDAGGLTLESSLGIVTIAASDVARLERRGDSLANGVFIGAVVPAISFFTGGGQGYDSREEAWRGLIASTVLGAAIGAGIDAGNRGWTTVFRANRPRRSAFFAAPVRRGVRVAYVRVFR